MTRAERTYLLREGHVLGFFIGSVLTTIWPPLAGVWLLVAVVLWVKSWRNFDAVG